MFKKISSFEQELIKEMQTNLISNQAENSFSFNNLSKAADYLNNAAELFDDVGMNKHAEAITKILEKIAHEDEEEYESLSEPSNPRRKSVTPMPGESEINLVCGAIRSLKGTGTSEDSELFREILNLLVNAGKIDEFELNPARDEDREKAEKINNTSIEVFPPDEPLELVTASNNGKKKL